VDATSVLPYPLLVITILTGPVGSGKTTFLERSLPSLRERHPNLDGYLSLRVLADGETAGYDLRDLRTAARTPLLRRRGDADGPRVGPYVLLPRGLAAAGEIIRRGDPADLLIVDEVGPLELAGGGVWPVLIGELSGRNRPALVVVRESLVDRVRAAFAGRELEVIRADAAVVAVSDGDPGERS
jgi:iron complex transport system ATP-binding protein